MLHEIGAQGMRWGLGLRDFALLVSQGGAALWDQIRGRRFRFAETIEQIYTMAVLSLPVMIFALVFVSLMFTLEFAFHMRLVLQQDSLVPAFSTIFLLREFGPVVTCFLLASRVGAAIAAEVATLRVSDQIDAFRLLGLDPVEYLLIPRWIGCVFACVTITVVALAVAIVAGALIASQALNYPIGQYFSTMFVFARWSDLQQCLVKSATFGALIPLIAVYQGLHCRFGPEGVGEATTNAVVYSFLLIFITDFLLTYLFYAL